MSDSTVRGRFVWHELVTTDPKSAGAFFSRIIGWKPKPWGNDNSYTLFMSGSHQRAGLMTIPEEARKEGAPPSWLTYIGTPNVDETARLATSLGATIKMPPADIPTVGRYAVMADPQGAVFGLYTPNRPTGPDTEPGNGEFSWHELATTDATAAFEFYRKLFGWEETSAMDMGEMGTYQMFGLTKQGRTQGGLFNKPSQMPGPPAWLAYIKVPDARKSADMIKKAGAQIVNGPMEVPGGDWIAQGVDPQGGMFAVHSTAARAAAGPAKAASPPRSARKSAKKTAGAKKTAAPKASARR
jgi:predicted enzyme related to lactoylglutathione lyase